MVGHVSSDHNALQQSYCVMILLLLWHGLDVNGSHNQKILAYCKSQIERFDGDYSGVVNKGNTSKHQRRDASQSYNSSR